MGISQYEQPYSLEILIFGTKGKNPESGIGSEDLQLRDLQFCFFFFPKNKFSLRDLSVSAS